MSIFTEMTNIHNKKDKKMNNEIQNNLYRLNDLEDQYQYYITNLDNIYAWACEQYNTTSPNAKQLNSIHEYELNYRDYDKIIDRILAKMKELKQQLPPVEYDGSCYRIVELSDDMKKGRKDFKDFISKISEVE